jgi:cobalamin synthase
MINLLLTFCVLVALLVHSKGNLFCQILLTIALLLFVILSLGMMELDGFEEFCDGIVDMSEVYKKLEDERLEPIFACEVEKVCERENSEN